MMKFKNVITGGVVAPYRHNSIVYPAFCAIRFSFSFSDVTTRTLSNWMGALFNYDCYAFAFL